VVVAELQNSFSKITDQFRVFHPEAFYRQKGGIRGGASWPHHGAARLGAGPRPPVVSLAPGPPLSHLGLRKASVKIGGLAFVLSNSENISCVTFLKHKNSRK
jgi:hypothetical protein